MADFERYFREIEIHLQDDPAKKEAIRQYYKGLDRGRIECVVICSVIIVIAIMLSL